MHLEFHTAGVNIAILHLLRFSSRQQGLHPAHHQVLSFVDLLPTETVHCRRGHKPAHAVHPALWPQPPVQPPVHQELPLQGRGLLRLHPEVPHTLRTWPLQPQLQPGDAKKQRMLSQQPQAADQHLTTCLGHVCA